MHSFKQHVLVILAIDILHVEVLNGISVLVQSTAGTESYCSIISVIKTY